MKNVYVLTIDSELSSVFSSENSPGGHVHAMLHCNRVACFMALENYCEANKRNK